MSIRRLLLPATAVALVSCGDATGPELPTPTTITPSAASLSFNALGQIQSVTAVVQDQTGTVMSGVSVVWSSGDDRVASVTSAGVVTAVGNGSTTLTAAAGDAERSIPVTVEQGVTTVEIEADSVLLSDPGDVYAAAAVGRDALGSIVASPGIGWQTGDPGVVTVDADGVVRAVETGRTFVVASAGTASDTLWARVEPELVLVAVGPTDLAATVDTELSLAARVEDVLGDAYAGATVTWSVDAGSGTIVSSAEAESDGTGHVTAVWRLGTVVGTQRASASIETRGSTLAVEFIATAEPGPAVTAALAADSALLSARGETAFLSPTYSDAFGNVTSGSGVMWTSADTSVVTAAADGLLTGVAEGATWVTASLDEPVDSILVTVIMRGAITVTFDDGWLSVYDNAWPVMQELELPANVAVYTEAVGFPAYMSEAHLDELHDAGWAMVSHTVNHDTLSVLSAGELDYELRAAQEWLVARGYRGSNIFVAPYHVFGPDEKAAASVYYTAARGTSANAFAPDSLVSWMPDRPFDLTGMEADDGPYTTPEGLDRLRALLQRTLDEGAFVDLVFHKVPAENVEDFRALMSIVAEFRGRVLPYDRLYPVWARTVF